MTTQAWDHDRNTKDGILHIVVATHSREVKTALFHSLNAIPTVTIVATGTSTAELVNYTHAFRPEIVIVETGLPGLPLSDVLGELHTVNPGLRILLIGEDTEVRAFLDIPNVEVFSDLDLLISTFPDEGANAS
jgi:DNA-binding NarL/FixJ family response regulator